MLEQELNREIMLLNKGLSEVDDKKSRLQQESKVMQSSAADEESKKIDPKDYREIEQLITELYYSSGTGDRAGNPKMGNAGVIQLLNEIEKNVDKYLQEFKVSFEISKDDADKEAKAIKSKQRKIVMEERQMKEAKEAMELAERRKKEKEDRKVLKVGKPAMARSMKEKLDRKKEVVKILTEEEKNRLRYLEME